MIRISGWRWVTAVFWAFAWLLFFQVPFYIPDFGPVYVLSKVGVSLVCVTLTLLVVGSFAAQGRTYPNTTLVASTILILAVQSALMARHWYGQQVVWGIAAQVKLFAGLYFFGVLALLLGLRPSLGRVRSTVLLAAFIQLTLVFLLWYGGHALLQTMLNTGNSHLVQFDEVRGLRITVQALPLEVLIFYEWRRLLARGLRSAGEFTCAIAAAYFIGVISGQRTEIVGICVVLAWVAAEARRVSLVKGMGVLAVLVAVWLIVKGTPAFGLEAVSRAAELRFGTALRVFHVIGNNPLRWLFGMGYLTRFGGRGTLQDVYGAGFWPSDVGWAGVLFEFGLIGVGVMAWWYQRLWSFARRSAVNASKDAAFIGSLRDLVLKMLVTSPLIPSLPLYMGAAGTVLAIATWSSRPAPRPIGAMPKEGQPR